MSDENVDALRAALEVSPDNVPLRRHLAQVLTEARRLAEAEIEWRELLRRQPEDADLMLELARNYRGQKKLSAAHVILEEMIRNDRESARARIERTRVFLVEGEGERAAGEYRKAIQEDPDVADAALGEQLGVDGEDEWSEFVDGRERAAQNAPAGSTPFLPEKPGIDFEGVGGMDDVKADITRKIIHPLKHPELYQAYGKQAGGGILLYGPPGCGKTHLARATAGEIDATFLTIGIHDVMEMWIGKSEQNLHEAFEIARANKPCVMFFDEADALGASRGDMRTSAGRQTINQFLAELDGVTANNEGILVLAATNAPWQMDPAFRRPGRFDRVVFVAPPDQKAREDILKILLAGKPQHKMDVAAVAKKTEGYSGADLRGVVEAAVETVIEKAMAAGAPVPLTTKDLLATVKQRKPTTQEWFRTARNYVLYSNEDGLYDDIKPYLKL